MDVEHGLALVDAIHGADFHAGLVLHVDTGLSDHIRHLGPPVQVTLGQFARVPAGMSAKACVFIPTRIRSVKPSASPPADRHSVRSFGSSASRSESPKRLKAKTERLIATPGKMAIHGAVSANSTAAPRSMRPHAA